MRTKRLALVVTLTALAVLGAAGAGFVLARSSGDGGAAVAQGPQDRDPLWYVPILEAEARKPRAVLTINGLTVGPGETAYDTSKCSGPAQELPLASADGSPLQIKTRYLPAGTFQEGGRAMKCASILTLSTADFTVPADRAAGRYGGWITITRAPLTTPRVSLDLPAEHFRSGSIAGRPAVLVDPATPDGLGQAAVVVKESFGVTLLQSNGITIDELTKVAQGLY